VGDALTVVNAFVVAAMIGVSPALADTVTCSTFAGVSACLGGHGYVSNETTWNGITTGSDNRGDRWTTSRWRDIETTTVEWHRPDLSH
jgi:hypothetical protein